MTGIDLCALLERIVRLREAVADGDLEFVAAIAEELEYDLVGGLEPLEEAA